MTSDPPLGTSRRRFLGSATALGVTATAGCLGSAFQSSTEEIEPEEPSDPPEGTASEFYYVLEDQDEFDIEIDDLYWADSALDGADRDLILEYSSSAESVENEPADNESANESETELPDDSEDGFDDNFSDSSDEVASNETEESAGEAADDETANLGPRERSEAEIGVIMQAYNEIMVKHGETNAGMLVGEVSNPSNEQAQGWGVKTEWLEQYNDGEMNELSLWMNVTGTRVYEDGAPEEDDLEGDLDEDDLEDDLEEDDLEEDDLEEDLEN